MRITLDVAARVFERFGEVLELDLRLDLRHPAVFVGAGIRLGKHRKNSGKSPYLMGKSTIFMAIFNSKLLVYQRVNPLDCFQGKPTGNNKFESKKKYIYI